MENKMETIIQLSELKQKFKVYGLYSIQVEGIKAPSQILLEDNLDRFLDHVKTLGQKHVYFKYHFYKKEEYFIPEELYDTQQEDLRSIVEYHNHSIEVLDFDLPNALTVFVIMEGVFIGIKVENDWIDEEDVFSADLTIEEIETEIYKRVNSNKKN